MDIQTSGIVHLMFWIVSLLTVISSVYVVTSKNVFRAAIALSFTFLLVSFLFFLMNAEFVGVVQILVYVGAVSVLIAFAVMFIKDVAGGSLPSRYRYLTAVLCILLFVTFVYISQTTNWRSVNEISNKDAVAGLTGYYVETVLPESGLIEIKAAGELDVIKNEGIFINSTPPIGASLISNFLVPFEILGLILVTTLIGSLMIIRNKKIDR